MFANILKSWSIVFVFLSALPLSAGTIQHEYMGEAMSQGQAHLIHGRFSRIELDANPSPVLNGALLSTEDGTAFVRLNQGISMEFASHSEIRFFKDADAASVELIKGSVRFSIPTGRTLGISSGGESLSVTGAVRYASLGGRSSVAEGVGIMGINPQGSFYMTTTGTPLVVTRMGKDEITGPGETIVIAQSIIGSKGLLKGLTRDQLGIISAQKGVKVVTGVAKEPLLAEGEIAISIPADIGGGFITGTREAIVAALDAAGIKAVAATTAAGTTAATGAGAAGASAGAWTAIGVAVVGGGALVAAGSGGGGGGSVASPVQ